MQTGRFGKRTLLGEKMIYTTIDLKISSTANQRLSWRQKAKVTQSHRQRAKNALVAIATPPSPPLSIVLTRIGPKTLDSDNLAYAFKAVRDGVADWLGVDDGSDQLDWQYCQRTGGAGNYSVEVEVI